ncbi:MULTISPECIES: PadR family transcriptional regulator [unclassified Streptomyces]|uniref:PadR family transcriptional regulator n=1 Tax=unclassified Streptomyces TaxID=2593676 RepID=UPI0033BE2D97
MSLRIALLGTLASRGPASGYELAKTFDDVINQVWQAKHSQIYPELAKMVESGAVTVEETGGGRGRKTYTITDAGRAEIDEWVGHPEPHRAVRNETALRAFLLPLLPPDRAAALMRALAEQHAALLDDLLKDRAGMDADTASGEPPFGTYALDLGIRTFTTLRDWARDTAEDLERRSCGGGENDDEDGAKRADR